MRVLWRLESVKPWAHGQKRPMLASLFYLVLILTLISSDKHSNPALMHLTESQKVPPLIQISLKLSSLSVICPCEHLFFFF